MTRRRSQTAAAATVVASSEKPKGDRTCHKCGEDVSELFRERCEDCQKTIPLGQGLGFSQGELDHSKGRPMRVIPLCWDCVLKRMFPC
jgi:hypothetical protein